MYVPSDVWPEMTGVLLPASLSSRAKRLARISSSDDVNAVSKEVCWEGFKIRPNRCGIQFTRLHLRDQVCNGEGFDLHISDDPMVDSNKVKSSLDATVSGTKTDDVEGFVSSKVFGTIHIYFSLICLSLRHALRMR